jgi:hypothetical protein
MVDNVFGDQRRLQRNEPEFPLSSPLKKTSHCFPNSGRDSCGLAEDHSHCPPQRCESYLEVHPGGCLLWPGPRRHGLKGEGGLKHPAA